MIKNWSWKIEDNNLRTKPFEKLGERYKVFERFSDAERAIFLFNNNDG